MDAAMPASQQAGPSGSGMPVVALLDVLSQSGKSSDSEGLPCNR